MTHQVYWIAGSPYSWRVLLALEIKGLKYESTILQASKKEHKTPEYLQLNPRGKVPSLTDDNKTIYESLAIIAYLDSKYPEPPLFGTTPEETGLIWQSILEFENYAQVAMAAIVRPVYFGHIKEKLAEIKQSAIAVRDEYKTIESLLARSNYLCGNIISAADIALFPAVMSLQRALSLEDGTKLGLNFLPYSELYPNIGKWIKRIEALSGYDKTYPPNWLAA